MNDIEIGVLQACQEYARRQCEMLPHLAAAIGAVENEVFYTRIRCRIAQQGSLSGGAWTYFFHGYECDLRNVKDGRYLRVDFGPMGRVGILNDYGVLQFIMTSVSPWHEFPKLRSYFAKAGPPFDENSGAFEKMSEVWRRLESEGYFEHADPGLVALRNKYTTRGPDGIRLVTFPPEVSENTRIDTAVAHRPQLSQKTIDFLKTHRLNGEFSVGFPTDAKVCPVTA